MPASRLKRLSEWTAEWAIRMWVLVLSSMFRHAPDTAPYTAMCIRDAREQLEKQRYGRASLYSRLAVAIDPKEPWGYLVTAYAYIKSGRESEVRAYLDRLPSIDPDDWGAFMLVGDLSLDIKRFDRAEMAYRQGLAAKPGDVNLTGKLARVIQRQGRLEEAEALIEHLERVAPDYLDAYFILAAIREEQGDAAGEMTVYERAVDRNPHSAEARYNLALAHGRIKQWSQAVAEIEKAIAIEPDNKTYLETARTLRKYQAGSG